MTNIFAALYLTIVVAIFKRLGIFLSKTIAKHLAGRGQKIFVKIMITLWAICGVISIVADFLSRMVIDSTLSGYWQKISLLAIASSFLIITITLIWRVKMIKSKKR